MSMNWVKIYSNVYRKKIVKFEEIKRELCRDSLFVILFGSRARGEATPLSDYDLLVVKQHHRGEKLTITWPAQVFTYGINEIPTEIQNLNTIILDALLEGILLCGDTQLFEKLKNQAQETVSRKGLKKTKTGWLPTT